MSGPEQLKDWMDRRQFNQNEAAKFIGVDFTYVSQLVNGVRNPGLTNALLIERKTGIPVEAWAASVFGETDAVPERASRKQLQDKA